jgi:Winged helix-turn-helix domain (DUF2582)
VSLPQLHKGTPLSAHLLAMGLGWLAREDTLVFVQGRPVLKLRLQDAPPACLLGRWRVGIARCLAVPTRARVRSVVWHGGTARRAMEKAVDMSYTLRLWHIASRSGVTTTASLR